MDSALLGKRGRKEPPDRAPDAPLVSGVSVGAVAEAAAAAAAVAVADVGPVRASASWPEVDRADGPLPAAKKTNSALPDPRSGNSQSGGAAVIPEFAVGLGATPTPMWCSGSDVGSVAAASAVPSSMGACNLHADRAVGGTSGDTVSRGNDGGVGSGAVPGAADGGAHLGPLPRDSLRQSDISPFGPEDERVLMDTGDEFGVEEKHGDMDASHDGDFEVDDADTDTDSDDNDPLGGPATPPTEPLVVYPGTRYVDTHDWDVQTAFLSPDGLVLASAVRSGILRIFEVRTGRLVYQADVPLPIVSTRFSLCGRFLALALTGAGATVHVLDASTYQLVARVPAHAQGTYVMMFSPCGRYMVSGGMDMTVRWHALPSFELLHVFPLPGHIFHASFVPDTEARLTRVLAACSDGGVYVLNLTQRTVERVLHEHQGIVYSVMAAPDLRHVASSGADGQVIVYELPSLAVVQRCAVQPTVFIFCATFSRDPQHRYVYASASDGTVLVLDRRTGQLSDRLRLHSDEVYSCEITADGMHLVCASGDGRVSFTPLPPDHWAPEALTDASTPLQDVGEASVDWRSAFRETARRLRLPLDRLGR